MGRALVFPGQGAQQVGMGMELAEAFPVCRKRLDEADAALGFALSDIIANGPEEELTRTDVSQPAILVVSWMAYEALADCIKRKPHFDACAGLSLGEYTALVAAGVLGFADAVRLVRLRGQAMQAAADAAPGGMVALIGCEVEQAEELCAAAREDGVLNVANLNSPGQVVASGGTDACERLVVVGKEAGLLKVVPLPVAGAFHSPLMAPAADRLRTAITNTEFKEPEVPVYHNVTATCKAAPDEIRELLVRQLTEPVRWAASVGNMLAAGIDQYWELGPGRSLSGMIRRISRDIELANLAVPDDAYALAQKA